VLALPRSGTWDSIDRDANIALFQDAAAAADRSDGVAGAGGSSAGGGGMRRFLLVSTYDGRDAARHGIPLAV